ncbi:fumarylacetoacetate hydrolase family protein [Herbiconiux sp.]|uniref:fumarylacetoacetate hydrolase family protein n=1 Tax=Herbiconiux sp. TaxID=1871186 RepID=UPI0025B9CA0B|nr:fumarylacetoacetate hydrolase family protein [Herbiconiux sp.]
MRLALFNDHRPGVVLGDELIDVSSIVHPLPAEAGGAWAVWLAAGSGTAALERALLSDALPRHPLDSVRLCAPLPRPGKIIAAPVNYLDHKIEMSEQKTIAEYGVFLKANSSVIGPGDAIELPYSDKRIDQEGELGIVIGTGGRTIPVGDALDHVAGYLGLLDISVRSTEDRSTRKSFDTFTPMGPWIVTADEAGDADDLQLDCWVAGEHRQSVSTAEMIFGVAELVAYASSVMTLHPGDVIASGTPAGVGPLADGDEVRLTIERLGTLVVSVTGQGAIPYGDRPIPSTASIATSTS